MDTTRTILHVDMNCFYASVEMAENPELRELPLIVGGDEESRHGIVLTASYPAKRRGVKTAMTLGEARRVCPEALVVSPHYGLYIHYSAIARALYNEYTDLVEPFGLDECWLDLTDSCSLAGGDAMLVAREISERMLQEVGCPVSVGVSWNKIFAKFGSDHDKPNGLMEVTPENYRDVVWPAGIRDLLYVGPATERKLLRLGIHTIGELAQADDYAVRRTLGKMGTVVQTFARGLDDAPVRCFEPGIGDVEHAIKGVGNGITVPFDVDDPTIARQVVWLMGESVAQRLREAGLAASTVCAWAREADTFVTRSRQTRLASPTQVTSEICAAATDLLTNEWDFAHGERVRAIGVRATSLSPAGLPVQLDLFGHAARRLELLELDHAIDHLRSRYGNHAVRRLAELADDRLVSLDPEQDNVVHPISFFA